MRASRVRRLRKVDHACVVHDVQPSAVAGLVKDGAAGAASLKEMVSQLGRPRTLASATYKRRAGTMPRRRRCAGAGAGSQRRAVRAVHVARQRDFANRVLFAMRYEFRGHAEKPAP